MRNLIGMKFNKLLVIKFIKRRGTDFFWECNCECGGIKIVSGMSLRNGDTKSCGCAYKNNGNKKTHGMTKTRFYKIYCGIKSRCDNINDTAYKNYGNRGIKYKWNSFEDFKKDMYEKYLEHCKEFGEKETSIDRIDVNGNYCKYNCRWITVKGQSNNKRTTHIVKYNGIFKSIKEWSIELGIPYSIFLYRINIQKMTIDKILLFKNKKYVRY